MSAAAKTKADASAKLAELEKVSEFFDKMGYSSVDEMEKELKFLRVPNMKGAHKHRTFVAEAPVVAERRTELAEAIKTCREHGVKYATDLPR
jgi:hypothetical protein